MSVDIVAENAKAGWPTSYTWAVSGAGDLTNQGFVRDFSVNVGQAAVFCCAGAGTRIDIFRMGWYGGAGWHKVAELTNTPVAQPPAEVIPNSNGATTCTNWATTSVWQVPADATSGLYVGVFHNADLSNKSWIPFVVRDDAATADIVYKTSESTWGAAYNYFGTMANPNGKNLYGSGQGLGNPLDRAFAVSYHRPIITRQGVAQTYFMACEAPMIRFLERNGFSVKYIASLDMDKVFLNAPQSVLLSSGHDEYWSANMRNAAIVHREQGGKTIFASANEAFWRTRYEYRGDEPVMWCHKDTMPGPGAHVAGQPLDPVSWTGTWKDTRWADRAPENYLTGTDFRMNGVNDVSVSATKGSHGVWAGTSGTTIQLTRAVGFEADSMLPTQPPESVKVLASADANIDGKYADDNGQNYTGNGTLAWGIVAQRFFGGGLTVGFGTCQWSWLLDATHDRGTGAEVNRDAQQFTVNLLSDLGAEPQTLMSSLSTWPRQPLDSYGIAPGGTAPPTPATSRFTNGAGVEYEVSAVIDGTVVQLSPTI